MANAADVARIIEGAGDYDEAIRRVQAAGLSTQRSEQSVLVGATTVVAQVGGNARANAYWVVYDTTDPSKSKVKVKGGSG